jgi:ERCC4-type nuclease
VITIDDREQSSIFINYLPRGLVQVSRLEYGDAEFIGNGLGEEPVLVGIERKAIGDLINSITSGRFAGHQLPGLLNSYNVVYLLVEGLYRPSGSGILEVRSGKDWQPMDRGRRWMYADLDCWLTTMEQKAGIRVRRASGPSETAAIILSIYRWWTSKDYSEHRAHLTLHRPPETALLRKASLVRVIAAELPNIGWVKSELVARKFHTCVDMVMADIKDWMTIEGIGRATAERIVKALYGTDAKRVKERRA